MDYIKFYKGDERFKDAFIKNIELLGRFSIYIDDDYYNASSKTFFIMDNNRIYTTITSMLNIVDNIKKIRCITEENGYTIQSFYIKNNIVNVKIIISKEYMFDNNLKLFMRYYSEKKKFEETVKNNNHLLLSTYINSHTKVLIDFKCGHKPNYVTPNSYNNGVRCPVCVNQKIENGVNDIATLRPDIVKYLKNKEDALKYQPYSKKRTMFACNKCGYEKEHEINHVSSFGFSCPNCSDGISYPNKFISNLLSQLNIEFETEVKFDWCKFPKYNSHSVAIGRYDVVINKNNLIIEMDGNLGHGNASISKSKDEGIYIDKMKGSLAKNHGYNLIRIRCDYKNIKDRFEIVKTSILSSDLSKYIDLSNVDWDNINLLSEMSYVNKTIELYNSNKNMGAKDIGKILHISTTCASNYLKIGNNLGLCNFNESICKDFRRKKLLLFIAKPISLVNTENSIKLYFSSMSECNRYFNKSNLYIKNNKTKINDILYDVEYISKFDFNRIKQETPEKAFGDFFLLDMKNKINTKQTPIEPEIELDGGYTYCPICYKEVTPKQPVCRNCDQLLDWSWFRKDCDKNE